LKITVKSRSAHLSQLAHSLDTQAALQRRRGLHHRRLLARDSAVPSSSLGFLQGSSEKIHLQGFVRQQSLQPVNFAVKCGFPGIADPHLILTLTIDCLQLMPPLV
jgi:hypothetical protein